jgi:hypothetical protein
MNPVLFANKYVFMDIMDNSKTGHGAKGLLAH